MSKQKAMKSFTICELDGKTYQLCFNNSAQEIWETLADRSAFQDLIRLCTQLKYSRFALYSCLQRYHGSEFPDLESVKKLFVDENDSIKSLNLTNFNNAFASEVLRAWGINVNSAIEESEEKKGEGVNIPSTQV